MRHSEAMIYRQWIGPRKPPKPEHLKKLLEAKAYTGQVTAAVVKRMRRAISLLVQLSPKRKIYNPVSGRHHDFTVGFTTLTVADQLKDSAADVYKKCMAPWLKWARYRGMKHYVWKAELQKRGTIHYHIATNVFMHYQLVRDKWNIYQKKAGYLGKYAAVNGHFRPNSTDVHAVRKVGNIEAYLTKYLVKGGGGEINGKVWDCSTGLKSSKYFSTELTWRNLDQLRTYSKKEIVGEHSTIFRVPPGKPTLILDPVQLSEYQSHLLAI